MGPCRVRRRTRVQRGLLSGGTARGLGRRQGLMRAKQVRRHGRQRGRALSRHVRRCPARRSRLAGFAFEPGSRHWACRQRAVLPGWIRGVMPVVSRPIVSPGDVACDRFTGLPRGRQVGYSSLRGRARYTHGSGALAGGFRLGAPSCPCSSWRLQSSSAASSKGADGLRVAGLKNSGRRAQLLSPSATLFLQPLDRSPSWMPLRPGPPHWRSTEPGPGRFNRAV